LRGRVVASTASGVTAVEGQLVDRPGRVPATAAVTETRL